MMIMTNYDDEPMMMMMLTYYDDADDLFYFLRLIMTVNTIIYHIDKK